MKVRLELRGSCFDSNLMAFLRHGSRENPDRFTDNRAPKAQESRGVRGYAPPDNFFNFNCLKCPLLASGVNRTIHLQVAFFLDGALQTYTNYFIKVVMNVQQGNSCQSCL